MSGKVKGWVSETVVSREGWSVTRSSSMQVGVLSHPMWRTLNDPEKTRNNQPRLAASLNVNILFLTRIPLSFAT